MWKLITKNAMLWTNENVPVNIGTEQMQSSEKLLGIKIDAKLDFEDHLGSICIKIQS